MRSKIPIALLLGAFATALAWSCWLFGGGLVTALEHAPYDHWLRNRTPVPISSAVVVITRDAASEGRFGSGPWDRAVLARTVTTLRNAGAAVVGLNIPIGEHSPPGRGGAASDAMLVEATKMAGVIVYPLSVGLAGQPLPKEDHSLWRVRLDGGALPMLAQHARELGHDLLVPDEDRVVRKMPLYVSLGDRLLPAFGFALAQIFLQVSPAQISVLPGRTLILRNAKFPEGRVDQLSVPIDDHGQILISYARSPTGPLFQSIPFLTVWSAIEAGETEKLHAWVGDKVVLVLAAPERLAYSTPVGQSTFEALQVNVLNSILTRSWLKESPPQWRFIAGLALACLAAWILLALPAWQGLAATIALLGGYLGMFFSAVQAGSIVLPVFVPVASLIVATGITTLWLQLTAGRQLRVLQGNMSKVQEDLVAVREALIRQESTVEDLEEDLEAARGAAARSAGTQQELAQRTEELQGQVVLAKAEEDRTRERLSTLESELRGLRAATAEPVRLGSAELERLRQECEQMGIITADPALLLMFRDIKKGARSGLPVLILGEPGTGKELFARAVHQLSQRAANPFVSVNMAAISPHLFESELFGHLRGSFTGAIVDRKGYFELAHQGTIFLDEIGDLQLEHQGKLLRVLQEKTFYRVGGTRPTTVDVRVVAATNKDLLRGISEGWFREDLYYRLKGLVLRLPPLRERPRDVALLAERFLREAGAQGEQNELALSTEALGVLEAQRWKGNIRELQHCLQRAAALAEGTVITQDGLRLTSLDQGLTAPGPAAPGFSPDSGSDQAVLACLREHGFDMQATARALGWDRSTVTQRLKGMGFQALVESGGDRAKAAVTLAGDRMLAHIVELKLREYYEHLLKTVAGFGSAEEAVAACKKRYKNLPERHFRSVETLIRQFYQRPSDSV